MMKQIACDDIFHSQSKNSKYIMLFLQNVPQDSLNNQIISMIKDNNKISTKTMASVFLNKLKNNQEVH